MTRLISILLLLMFVGCGYHVPGHEDALPEGVKKIYLPLFSNRTSKPGVETGLTNAVAEVLSQIPAAQLGSEEGQADAVVEGTILTYSSTTIAYDKNDIIKEYSARMSIEIKLRKTSDGRLLWQNRLTWQEPYLANADKSLQNDLEDAAIREIQRRLAEEFRFRLLADF